MKKEMSARYAELLMVGVEKITSKVIDSTDQQRIIKQQLNELEKKL